jgi:hypothetical protein
MRIRPVRRMSGSLNMGLCCKYARRHRLVQSKEVLLGAIETKIHPTSIAS